MEILLTSEDPASEFDYAYQWYANYPPKLIGDQDSLTLIATVKDTDSLSHTFTWNSSIDGILGTTNPITISSLSPGEHTIIVTVIDADGSMEGLTIRLQLMLVKLQYLPML